MRLSLSQHLTTVTPDSHGICKLPTDRFLYRYHRPNRVVMGEVLLCYVDSALVKFDDGETKAISVKSIELLV